MKFSTRQIALTSIFAGFYYLFSFLPGIPAPGIADIKIQVEACLATVFGYILGPFLGGTATFLGVFIAWLLPPGNMALTGLIFVPSPVINAVVSGFLFQRRWKAAAISLGALILAFWFTPPTQPVTEFWSVGIAVTWDKIIALLLIGSVILLDRRIQKENKNESQRIQGTPRPWLVPSLLIISSILILSNNFLVAIAGKAQKFQYGDFSITFGYKTIINALGNINYVWIVVGILPLLASIMLLLKPEKRRVCAIVAISSSLISVLTGGGFIVGTIMAVVVGFFAFFGDIALYQSSSRLDILRLFIMAFIGNEADNMWGSLIFSIPAVYQTLYAIPSVDIVRWLFLLSPFAYPAIRFLQAIVATMVAVPLLRTLKAAKLVPSMAEINVKKQQQ